MKNRCFGMTYAKLAVAALLCCVSVLVTGCSMSQFVGPANNSPILAPAMQGIVHGGRQPISGSTVQLWSVGGTNYGAGASALGSAVTTNASGGFTLGAYTCPTASTLTYITASGGNSGGGGNNPNIMLAAALGACGNLSGSTFISMNEVTTAATAYALGQYFTPAIGGPSSGNAFGAPASAQAQTGITNAFATANNLVNTTTGAAVTSLALTGPGGAVTATPESAKLNTVANILAACVNSLGVADSNNTSCATLFGGVVSSGGVAPTDTLQAAVYMSLNPTSNNANGSTTNLAALYALVTGTPPYVGVSAQPTDWTIGIQYTDTTAATVLLQPQNVAVDASGNIWVVSGTTSSNLVELSPTGVPQVNVLSAALPTGLGGSSPRNLAVDLNGNLWITSTGSFGSSSGYIFEVNSAGTIVGSPLNTNKSAYGLAIDGNNNVFVGESSSSAHYELIELLGGNIAQPIAFPIATSTPGVAGANGTNTFVQPQYMAFDTTGNLWMTNGSTTGNGSNNQLVELTNINTTQCPSTGTFPCPTSSITSTSGAPLTTSTTMNTYTGFGPSGAAFAEPTGIAANINGMWVANQLTGTNTVSNIALSGSTGATYGSSTSIGSPRYVAVDGAGNIWAPNHGGSGTAISEFSSTGAVLSPVNSTVAPFLAVGFVHPGLASCLQGAIDPSGNVWVANNSATAGVFELVGAAAPTVTPTALALKNNKVGAKP
jgi:hypothetical protein